MPFEIAGLRFSDATGIPFHHDLTLVVISYVVAAAGSYAALELIERWRNAAGARRVYLHLASAVALGGTIWSMHFIAMQALRMRLSLTYAFAPTALSLLIAIGVAAWGLWIAGGGASRARRLGAGVVVGLGVAAMHYVGMAGLRFAGSLAYSPGLWSLSLLIAIAAATIVLWLSLTLEQVWQRAGAALIMAGGICGMHYTGMAATVFRLGPEDAVAAGIQTGPVAAAVALAALSLILCALVFVVADRQMLAAAQREAAVLRHSYAQLAAANADMALGHRRLDAVLNGIRQGVCFFDGEQRLLVYNRRYLEIYDLPLEANYVGRSLESIVDARSAVGSAPDMGPSEYLLWRQGVADASTGSSSIVTLANGRIVVIDYHPMPDGGWIATHDDVTERKDAQTQIAFMAQHDALTGLPNRASFDERLRLAAASGDNCAVLCLDLDRLQPLNDTLGHAAGDRLLQAVAERLSGCVRATDTVARLGGDEFGVIHSGVVRPDETRELAARMLAVLDAPFDIQGHSIRVGVTVGVASAPGDGGSAQELLKNAETALYLAKADGRGTARFFTHDMAAPIRQRRSLEFDLQGALGRGELAVHYQAQVDLTCGCVTGFEALLRWHHPVRGMVSPVEFIGLAEETGLIVDIGAWVLRMACREAMRWPSDIRVAVNLSPVQFKTGTLVATVKAALEETGLAPARLELEITESVMLQDSVATLAALHELRGMGIGVALDDFGTGYSSLSYLRRFAFDKIKIDQFFVREMMKNDETISIIRAVIGLGRSLRMRIIAEGVQTQAQLETLRAEGCLEGQGYLFSRPVPAGELPALIASRRPVLALAM